MPPPPSDARASAEASQAPMRGSSEPHPATAEEEAPAAAPDRCVNCGAPLQGAYCHRCSQPAATKRLRLGHLATGLLQGLLDLDSKTLRTAGHLLIRPGSVARAYLAGNRVRYLSPLRYYLVVVAFNLGLSAFLGTTDVVSAGANSGQLLWGPQFAALQLSLLYALVAIPIAVGQWLLRRKGPLTVTEHYACLLYLLGQSILVLAVIDMTLLAITGATLQGDTQGLAWLTVFTVHIIWAGQTAYREAIWQTAWRTAAAYAIAMLISGTCLALGLSLRALVTG